MSFSNNFSKINRHLLLFLGAFLWCAIYTFVETMCQNVDIIVKKIKSKEITEIKIRCTKIRYKKFSFFKLILQILQIILKQSIYVLRHRSRHTNYGVFPVKQSVKNIMFLVAQFCWATFLCYLQLFAIFFGICIPSPHCRRSFI